MKWYLFFYSSSSKIVMRFHSKRDWHDKIYSIQQVRWPTLINSNNLFSISKYSLRNSFHSFLSSVVDILCSFTDDIRVWPQVSDGFLIDSIFSSNTSHRGWLGFVKQCYEFHTLMIIHMWAFTLSLSSTLQAYFRNEMAVLSLQIDTTLINPNILKSALDTPDQNADLSKSSLYLSTNT